MRRDPRSLAGNDYDVLVIGAGIHGACVARDAALRGLRVALVDRGDFGGETSHNSLKIMHGGLRYLQHLDLRRVRQSIRERCFWLRAAPHLVKPLEFVVPTYGHGMRGPEAFRAAIWAYGILSRDRNRGVPATHALPLGGVISRREARRRIPGVGQRGLSGAAIWYEGQAEDVDRVLLECVRAAADAGASVANYVEVEEFILHSGRVVGARARDVLTGQRFLVRSALTVNAAGPWAIKLICAGGARLTTGPLTAYAKGINLVLARRLADHAFGIVSGRASNAVIPRGGRLFFVTPWFNRSIVGTSHLPYKGNPDAYQPGEEEVSAFIAELNDAWPEAALTRKDVLYCYSGLSPAHEGMRRGEVYPALHGEIRDHERHDRVAGILSVIGVKYTTARLVAERVVDLVLRKLRRRAAPCQTEQIALASTDHDRATRFAEADDGAETSFRAACRHAVREECAVRLGDVLFRRTNLVARGELTRAQAVWCADWMSGELRWPGERTKKELDDTMDRIAQHRGLRAETISIGRSI